MLRRMKSRLNLNFCVLQSVSLCYLDVNLCLKWENARTNSFFLSSGPDPASDCFHESSVTITVGQIRFTGTSEEKEQKRLMKARHITSGDKRILTVLPHRSPSRSTHS